MIFWRKAWGVSIREKLLEISEYFAIPTIPRSSSFDDEKRIVGIVKIIKKKNTLLLTPHASEKWIRRKTPFYILKIYLATDIIIRCPWLSTRGFLSLPLYRQCRYHDIYRI
jgi:hypothetical protein